MFQPRTGSTPSRLHTRAQATSPARRSAAADAGRGQQVARPTARPAAGMPAWLLSHAVPAGASPSAAPARAATASRSRPAGVANGATFVASTASWHSRSDRARPDEEVGRCSRTRRLRLVAVEQRVDLAEHEPAGRAVPAHAAADQGQRHVVDATGRPSVPRADVARSSAVQSIEVVDVDQADVEVDVDVLAGPARDTYR